MHRSFVVTAILGLGLVIATKRPALSQDASARNVLASFCDLDSQGAQVAPGGWEKVVGLFATPGTPRRDLIMVVRDYAVSQGSEKGRSAAGDRMVGFHVVYTVLGLIDPSEARFDPNPPGLKVEPSLFVVRQARRASGGSSRLGESAEWRIEGSVPEPHLSVDASIRYTAQLRESATDETVRRNADRALAALKRLR